MSITGLRGPGLRDVTATGAPVTSEVEQRVGITARVDCTDPSLQTAGATSYTLAAAGSQTGADPEAGTVPLATAGSRPITSLDKAITDWCLAARGLDPDGLTVPEAGLFAAGRPAYAEALRAYASGTPEGVARWIVLHAETVRVGAAETRRILADLA